MVEPTKFINPYALSSALAVLCTTASGLQVYKFCRLLHACVQLLFTIMIAGYFWALCKADRYVSIQSNLRIGITNTENENTYTVCHCLLRYQDSFAIH